MTELSISNSNQEDFLRHHTSVKATRDGRSITWTIPDRLTRDAGILGIIVEELLLELGELDGRV